ncbi:RNA polymerase subunit sigma-70 [Corallococcus exiguus]|uniref:RNA polymerase subunit sigma-70 n=1 Tax=Corallococcus exiguus TaxID=83462 RepID=A0A7X4Y9F9_9BACT|nr:RNA polymerase subunit sigma-70 [Corallococcus exiguus]NBC41375.1 RNA polymerase subunit sigma-70 [Corallococcus exiguus]TNV66981.1 RNA polymerase subunit sigma-70 [Corallococcus exiguus]
MNSQPKRGILTALLREHLSREQRSELETVEGLEVLLHEHVEAARTGWPTLPLPVESFMRHLARHLPAGKASEVMRILHGADLYLACACSTGEPSALRAFEQDILRRIPARLGRVSPNMVDEVLQVLRERLLVSSGSTPPRIATYGGRGPLLTWVGIIAARITGELVGRDERHQLVAEPPEELARHLAPSDPEYALLREDARQFLVESLRKAVAVLPEQERPLLRLHHFHGFTMDRLALMYGGSRSGVARKLADAREQLLERVRMELAPRLKQDQLALESLLGLVSSRLDISLLGMLD